ncbi:hypothetical protein NDJ51_15415 [Acinetobacter baumannii]|nr:hypothetical protein [Acinetobacter baumannii]
MQIQIGIDIVLILAFLAYLSVVTGWNSKNKAAYIKQFRHVPISLLFKEIRYMYFLCTRQISQNPYPIRVLPS